MAANFCMYSYSCALVWVHCICGCLHKFAAGAVAAFHTAQWHPDCNDYDSVRLTVIEVTHGMQVLLCNVKCCGVEALLTNAEQHACINIRV